MTNGNGDAELPDNRAKAVEAGLTHFQSVAAERDSWERKCRDLEANVQGWKIAMEAQDARLVELESRAVTMQLERDEAVAERAVYETLFISLQAQMRAFKIPSAPLIRDRSEEKQDGEPMPYYDQGNYPPHPVGDPIGGLVRELVNAGRSPIMPEPQRSEEAVPERAPVLGPQYR